MRAFAAGAAILILGACQSILGIGDTTLGQSDGAVLDAPLTFDARPGPDAPLTFDALPGADARSGDDGPAADAACGACAASADCAAPESPICVSCFCTTCTSPAQCKERAGEVGDKAALCNASGFCVQCLHDQDCKGPTPICDFNVAHGTCVAPPSRACGSLSVPSTGGEIVVPPNPAYVMAGSFTIEAWVRPHAFHGVTAMIVANATSSDIGSYGLYLDGVGVPFFSITNQGGGTTTQARASPALAADVWTHLAGTYDNSSGQMVLWVNGARRATASVASPPSPGQDPLTLGSSYDGYIDEVRLALGRRYTEAFYPERFFPATVAGDVAHFHLDEASGSYAIDASPTANDGVLTGDAALAPVCQYYRCGSVVTYGGFVEAPNVPALTPSGSFTLEAYVQPQDLSGGGASNINVIDRAMDPDGRSYHMFIDASLGTPGFEVSCDGASWQTALSSLKIPAFGWTHLAGIYDAGLKRVFLYQNGTLQRVTEMFTCTPAGPIHDSGQPLIVASDFGGFARFRGFVDEVRLSSTVRYTTDFSDQVFDLPATELPDDEASTLALYHFDESGLMPAADSSVTGNDANLVADGTDVAFDTRCF